MLDSSSSSARSSAYKLLTYTYMIEESKVKTKIPVRDGPRYNAYSRSIQQLSVECHGARHASGQLAERARTHVMECAQPICVMKLGAPVQLEPA